MCGITGYWARSGQDIGAEIFHDFTERLAHRGPDGSGEEHFPAEHLRLGHRRLAILDISERGRQPMSCASGRYWLTFNGEIYNFIELRRSLIELGHRFVSESDSEVILAAYTEWGRDCQLRFNGMWAFAIWDCEEHTLFLSRDRFGIKPLYYAERNGSFCFASELKAFLALPWCDGSFAEDALALSIADMTGQEIPEATLLPGVQRLLPGHCLTVTNGTLEPGRWWNTLEHLPAAPCGLRDQAAQFRDLFLDACRIRLRSDVSIASSLSGGLDSSAIVSAVADLARRNAVDHVPKDWHRAFIACFPATRLDERAYAEQVVAHTGMSAEYCVVDDAAALAGIEQVIFDLEGLYPTPLVGPWAVYRAMRAAGIPVSLDGHGADELLGGYHFFVDQALLEQIGRRFRLRRYLDLRRVRAGLEGATVLAGSGEKLGRQSVLADFRAALRSGRGGQLPEPGLLRHRPEIPRPGISPPHLSPPHLSPPSGASRLFSAQFTNFHARILPAFLRCIDRASMAHGVEVRNPFLDWRLVTYGFALPDESRIGGGFTKRVLRLAMQGLMPESIRQRTNKFHFSSPVSEWARGALRTWLLDLSASRSFLEASLWDGPAARRAVEHAVAGAAEIGPVWPIVNAHVLQQSFKRAALKVPESAAASASMRSRVSQLPAGCSVKRPGKANVS